jgi:DNA polymerase III subunit chi
MGVVMFYHLTRSGADDTLLTLMSRAASQGWRVMIRGTDPTNLARLDDLLWTRPADGFAPHGLEGGPSDADQPVLLGPGAIVNGAKVLALIDGAGFAAPEAAATERVWVLFDGGDEVAVSGARDLWRQATEAGLSAQYWTEDTGRWQMKMEKAPA